MMLETNLLSRNIGSEWMLERWLCRRTEYSAGRIADNQFNHGGKRNV